MAARSKARKRALDILFEAEVRGEPVLDMLEQRVIEASPPVGEYAAELVRGVQAHRERIDQLLEEHAEGWTLDRMPIVDRNVLRIGLYEMLWGETSRTGWRSARPCCWPATCPPTRRLRSSTACWPICWS